MQSLRLRLRKVALLRALYRRAHCLYLWIRYSPQFLVQRLRCIYSDDGREWRRELDEIRSIRDSGLYGRDEPLTNRLEPYQGRNFLGYPAYGGLERQGIPIGWLWGQNYVTTASGEQIRAFQSLSDLEENLPLVIMKYRPEVVFDFGTANGATAWLFQQHMRRYCANPRVLSVDVQDVMAGQYGGIHRRYGQKSGIEFLIGDATGREIFRTVQSVFHGLMDERVLFSFDDDHSAAHVYRELTMYAPLLKVGDVFLVQDTWDQGLNAHMLSPLPAVLRFRRERPEFELDLDVMRQVTMPCNFVHGLLVRRA